MLSIVGLCGRAGWASELWITRCLEDRFGPCADLRLPGRPSFAVAVNDRCGPSNAARSGTDLARNRLGHARRPATWCEGPDERTLQGMAGADQPVPPAGPSSGASFAGSDEPAPSRNPFGRLAHGRWVVFVLCALALLLWAALAANAVYQHQWVDFAGYTCIAVLFLVVPAGVTRRLSHMLMSRKPPGPDPVPPPAPSEPFPQMCCNHDPGLPAAIAGVLWTDLNGRSELR